MRRKVDVLSQKILSLLKNSQEPLETKEIELALNATRIKVLYRLHNLRGEGLVKGKAIGSGKGVWVWWDKDAF